MPKGVTRVTLEINSVVYDFFSSFTEEERTVSKQTNYMNTTGSSDLLVRHNFSLDRIRSFGDNLDFATVSGGTVTVEYETGDRVTFTGVRTTTIGSETADGESDMTSTISFSAENRIEN